jgi:UDP-N-acetylglucosamine acyltransferase
MTDVDPTARIANGAVIGAGATIGPYCIVGPNVVIGEGCRLIAHVHITGHTTIGAHTTIHPFASLGSPPQSVKYRGGPTRLVIGAHCDIREGVTMSTGTEDANGVTQVGDRCFFMVGSHVAHDCVVGNDVTLANNVLLGGHVEVGNNVFFGGHAGAHQFVRVGEGAMISGLAGVREDVIPFGFALGAPGHIVGLNVVGLRRRGVARADIHRLRRAFRLLFDGEGCFADRVASLAGEFENDPIVGKIVAFVRQGGHRALMKTVGRVSGTAGDAAPE